MGLFWRLILLPVRGPWLLLRGLCVFLWVLCSRAGADAEDEEQGWRTLLGTHQPESHLWRITPWSPRAWQGHDHPWKRKSGPSAPSDPR